MQILTIPQVLAMEPDLPVTGVKVKIKNVYKQKSGTKKNGDKWTLQDVVGTDGNNDIAVKIWDLEIPMSAKGKWFYLLSQKGTKGWTGVKTKDDEYDDKDGKHIVKRVLNVTASAEILSSEEYDGRESGAPAGREPDERLPDESPEETDLPMPPPKPKPKVSEEAKDAVTVARLAAGKMANGLLIACAGAAYIAKQAKEKHGVEFGPSEIERIMVHINITLERQGYIGQLPSGPMDKLNGNGAKKEGLSDEEYDKLALVEQLAVKLCKKDGQLLKLVERYLAEVPGKGGCWLKHNETVKDLTLDRLRAIVNGWDKFLPPLIEWEQSNDQVPGAEVKGAK